MSSVLPVGHPTSILLVRRRKILGDGVAHLCTMQTSGTEVPGSNLLQFPDALQDLSVLM